MSQRRWLICTLLLVSSALAQSSPPKLEMVVILTRHGVRAPIKHDGKSDFIGQGHFAQQPWPKLNSKLLNDPNWDVQCDGFLTPTGYELATLMGAYYRDYYNRQGLLPDSCPSSQQVDIWADNEQRTFQTARALAQGLTQKFPGCNVPVKSLDYKPPAPPNCKVENKTDYFFHPLANPALKSRVILKELDNIANSINASLRRLNRQYREELTLLQNVLLCCDSSECPGSTTCTLPTLPDRAWVIDDDKALKWEKRFSTASTASEVFLLEYATGMPCEAIGWGRVNTGDCKPASGNYFRWMQNLHTLYFDKINRARYVAKIQGSNLANQILLRLQKGVDGSPTPLVIFAGHDTNLANIAAMLGISWRLPDLPDNDTPPAGALVFELYSAGTSPKNFFVELHYVHATMTQLRNKTVLSWQNPPNSAPITLPACVLKQCPFKTFESIMNKAIDKNFTTKGPSGD